jgi:oxygen-independent coproporphyrinogen-3 oxidase
MEGGLYIHVPFCRRRCPFCDYWISTNLVRVEEYLDALEREMALRASGWPLPFDTVYLGGGTPSVLGPEPVRRILASARSHFQVSGGAEVTLEANPGNLGPGEYEKLREAGVNRISLGIQSFQDRDLLFLGRDHSAAESAASFHRARREGFQNISIDLLYGLPGRPRELWAEQIGRARDLGPEHISAYQLDHPAGTPFSRRIRRGEIRPLSEEEARDLFIFTCERLSLAGYGQYEISSFPRSPEFESRHNRKYWEGAPYLGLGPSAHSYREPARSWNASSLGAYLNALAAGRDPGEGEETLRPEERRLERLFLGLRTIRGVQLNLFRDEFGYDLRETHRQILKILQERGLSFQDGEFLKLTREGMALADEIALELAGEPPGKGK